ncbi:MAG TPA: chemotaxis-specific protein-glutamate methyltransferase CheB [Roseiarcus sp.]|jgi:two-component system chemotaxis response regulator CheB
MIKVLVIDDSALTRKLLGRVLGDVTEFEVHFARNGVEGLEKLAAVNPDVITLDIHMPGMDGLTCLDRIMIEHPRPVLMVSSLTGEGADATLEALRLGAVDFAPKPEGALSLHMDAFGPLFVAKVRAAANSKPKASLRLRERVQHRFGGRSPARPHVGGGEALVRAKGDGIVLVGASTGGPLALEVLLGALPSTFPWPIVIAQHMPANFTGALARRLDGLCAIGVSEVTRPETLEPGHAYIGRGDGDVVISRIFGDLVASPAPADMGRPWRPSADRLVESAIAHVPPNLLVGVLMTGMGDDGAASMTRLRALGGRTIAEAEETAVVWGMPGQLVEAGGATWVLPLPNIAQQLRKLAPLHAAHPQRV